MISQTNNRKQEKQQRESVAESRVSFGHLSALALRIAIKNNNPDDEVLLGLYQRLSACALRQNHWIGDDLHNVETGELYEANGNFWGCGSRLCPSCVAKLSRRSRNQLRFALENQKLFCGENYQFITLTMPNPNRSVLRSRGIIDRAWSLLRKRDYFKNRIRGGSKNEEFTVTENGYHYHIHLLCVTRFLAFERLRREWTECLEIAFKESGLVFDVKTSDGLAMVNVQRVSGRQKLQGAVLEVCKYITKNDSWEKIPPKDLIEIASIKRFPRMFELFGCFRENRKENQSLSNTASDNDTDSNDPLNNPDFAADVTMLDTKRISDGENFDINEFSGNSPPEENSKRRRQMNWRDFIEAFGIEDYLERLSGELERAWEWRKLALKQKYPYASFRTLEGQTF